ncbi:Uncharacterised protein [uncultured archaeon]|nr:Uncharacterised protein [uncultured archaeon]
MDSDVMLFENITEDAKNFAQYDYLLGNGNNAGLTIINNTKVLLGYRDIVLDFYTNKIGKAEYEANGTITDMSFWKEMKRRGEFKLGEITSIINGASYDAGLFVKQEGVILKNGEKEIFFKNGIPYARGEGEPVRMKCLHCQGPTKFYMKYFARGNLSAVNKKKVKLMMWLRNTFSPLLSSALRTSAKKVISKTGF